MIAIGVLALVVLTLVPLGSPAWGSEHPSYGSTSIAAQVPPPGHAEGIAVRGRTFYVGTTVDAAGLAIPPERGSALFAFDARSGELRYRIDVAGEDLSKLHGLAGMAFDADGRLYVSDVQQGILRFDLSERAYSTYAQLPDLPSCVASLLAPPCSPTVDDRVPLGNDIVFDEAGNLYVTDSAQATIWRIRPGGDVSIWFQDRRLDGPFGANGIRLHPDRQSMYFAVTGTYAERGSIYRLPFVERPRAGDLEEIASWQSLGPDGIEFGASGLLYVVLGGGDQIAVLDPETGRTVRSFPRSPLENEHFHNPASPAFHTASRSLLITNHAFFDREPSHQTVVRAFVDDVASPLAIPDLP